MKMKPALAATLCVSALVLLYDQLSRIPQPLSYTQTRQSSVAVPPAAAAKAQPAQQAATASESDGTEFVLGLRVRKDRNCRVELNDYVTPDGAMFSAYSCTPVQPAAAHEYADYTNETLEGMAYADADAAALLGQRLIASDTSKSYALLIRASALDGGNREHIAWLSDQAFSAVAINGEPHLGNLQRRYELAALAARLGGSPELRDTFRQQLTELGVNTTTLAQFDSRADALFKSMQAIQRHVQGEVTLGGQGDA